MILVEKVSTISGKTNSMMVNTDQMKYNHWCANRAYLPNIQEYFSELNADEREFILSGVTPEEWDMFMGEDE